MTVTLTPEPPGAAVSRAYRGPAVLALGFRPFYLLAAAFAVASIAAWAAIWLGWRVPHQPAMGALLWHAHEMVFGFACAVVVGFLLTAGKAWTGVQTPQGGALAALAALWLAPRVLFWTGPALLATVLDAAFLPLCAVVFYRVLTRADSRRNFGLAAMLMLLGTLNASFHIALANHAPEFALRAAEGGIGLVAMFVTIIGGRVIPMFTTNAIAGIRLRRAAWADTLVVPAVVVAVPTMALIPSGLLAGAPAFMAATVLAVRVGGWNSVRTWRRPVVFILHLAYAFLPLGFLLLGLAAMGWVDRSIALHALTVGAIGCAIVAMITRTALGHTGRPIEAGRTERAAYACIVLAAVARVLGPLVLAQWKPFWIGGSAVLWVTAFSLYLVKYAPLLARPRADGKPG
jgi:uncharacterized protein involved in response to NO